jgi:hypothetical protein
MREDAGNCTVGTHFALKISKKVTASRPRLGWKDNIKMNLKGVLGIGLDLPGFG